MAVQEKKNAQEILREVTRIGGQVKGEIEYVERLGDAELTRRFKSLHQQAEETRDYLKSRIEK